ncbi:unnamed protein product [Protopolystoma xenopodis]|uniref:Uncharacterized protein n=1 Tax=Protopolystoma xenopodis TaxID=117903 RepID=A0A448XLG4_9PLAT|nr:unnamed protein product [Protopolystoma xenopodis]
MTKLTDDADYDGGETFGNVPRPLFNFGNDHADNELRTRCIPLSVPTNMTMLRKQGQTTYNFNRIGYTKSSEEELSDAVSWADNEMEFGADNEIEFGSDKEEMRAKRSAGMLERTCQICREGSTHLDVSNAIIWRDREDAAFSLTFLFSWAKCLGSISYAAFTIFRSASVKRPPCAQFANH